LALFHALCENMVKLQEGQEVQEVQEVQSSARGKRHARIARSAKRTIKQQRSTCTIQLFEQKTN